MAIIHPQMRPETGLGADAAKNAAEVLRQYVERAREGRRIRGSLETRLHSRGGGGP